MNTRNTYKTTTINRWLRGQFKSNYEMKKAQTEPITLTSIEWLSTIEDKNVRKLALKYLQSQPLGNPAESFENFTSALLSSFIWGYTPQGYEYWKAIFLTNGKTPKISDI